MQRSQIEVIAVIGVLGGIGLVMYEYYGKDVPQSTNTDFQGKSSSKKNISAGQKDTSTYTTNAINPAVKKYVNANGDVKIDTPNYTAVTSASTNQTTIVSKPGTKGYPSLVNPSLDAKKVGEDVLNRCTKSWASDSNFADVRLQVLRLPPQQQNQVLRGLCINKSQQATLEAYNKNLQQQQTSAQNKSN